MRDSSALVSVTQQHNDMISLRFLIRAVGHVIVPTFTLFFLAFALLYAAAAVFEVGRAISDSGDLIEGLVKGLHMGVVALAVYELSQIIYQEYDSQDQHGDMVGRIRRGLIRFVSVACTALVLEALIMVIKYSQKDLAGFLYYPVAIVVSAAMLLIALGAFTKLTCSISVQSDA